MKNKRILISSFRILFRNKLNTLFMILGILIGIAADFRNENPRSAKEELQLIVENE